MALRRAPMSRRRQPMADLPVAGVPCAPSLVRFLAAKVMDARRFRYSWFSLSTSSSSPAAIFPVSGAAR